MFISYYRCSVHRDRIKTIYAKINILHFDILWLRLRHHLYWCMHRQSRCCHSLVLFFIRDVYITRWRCLLSCNRWSLLQCPALADLPTGQQSLATENNTSKLFQHKLCYFCNLPNPVMIESTASFVLLCRWVACTASSQVYPISCKENDVINSK